jgi:DNA-binding Lrp family transcriptional regulator
MKDGKDISNIHLTKNDKHVLKEILEHGRISDSSIARGLGITPQAVVKIRNKLEDAGIIEGYVPRINYKKLGLDVMALVVVKLLPAVWEVYTEPQVQERIRLHQHIVWSCRVVGSDATHVFLYGFKDHRQMEEHFHKVQTKLNKAIEIKDMFTFSADKIIKDNPIELLRIVIDDEEYYHTILFREDAFSAKR